MLIDNNQMINNQKKGVELQTPSQHRALSTHQKASLSDKFKLSDKKSPQNYISSSIHQKSSNIKRKVLIQEAFHIAKQNKPTLTDADITYKQTEGEEISMLTPTQKLPPNQVNLGKSKKIMSTQYEKVEHKIPSKKEKSENNLKKQKSFQQRHSKINKHHYPSSYVEKNQKKNESTGQETTLAWQFSELEQTIISDESISGEKDRKSQNLQELSVQKMVFSPSSLIERNEQSQKTFNQKIKNQQINAKIIRQQVEMLSPLGGSEQNAVFSPCSMNNQFNSNTCTDFNSSKYPTNISNHSSLQLVHKLQNQIQQTKIQEYSSLHNMSQVNKHMQLLSVGSNSKVMLVNEIEDKSEYNQGNESKSKAAQARINEFISKTQFNFVQSPKLQQKHLTKISDQMQSDMRKSEIQQQESDVKISEFTVKPQSIHSKFEDFLHLEDLLKQKKKDESDTSEVFNENIIKESFEKRSQRKQFLHEMIKGDENVLDDPENTHREVPKTDTHLANQLLELNLRLANLKEVQRKLFYQNPSLRFIDLRNNRLTKIPDNICDLVHLWKLRVDYNYISELPFYIGKLANLEFLSASQNKIQSIPESLFQIRDKMQILQLNDNNITFIPNEIGQLSGLKSLLIQNNQFFQVPASLQKMQKLMEFGMDWLQYLSVYKITNKIAKDDAGLPVIRDFLSFCSVFDQAKKEIDDQEQLHFVHFLMYFMSYKEPQELNFLKYQHKSRSLIHLLSLNGHAYLLKEVLNYCENLDINNQDEEGNTPLILAIKNKRVEMIKYLIRHPNTKINLMSKRYGHPLHLAIQCQEYKLAVKLLKYQIKHPAKYLDINAKSEDGNNCLHFLFLNFYQNPQSSRYIAKILIKRGINVNLKNKNSLTPLHLAIINSQNDAITFALEHNKHIRKSKINQYLSEYQQNSSIMFDFNSQGGVLNWNTLHFAIQTSNFKTITLLLQSHEENISFIALDEDGKKPKDLCAYNSPVYKLVQKYEQTYMKTQYQIQNQQQKNFLIRPEFEISHYQVNKKNIQSPTKIREKLIEKAKTLKTEKKLPQKDYSFRPIKVNNESESDIKEKDYLLESPLSNDRKFGSSQKSKSQSRIFTMNRRKSSLDLQMQGDNLETSLNGAFPDGPPQKESKLKMNVHDKIRFLSVKDSEDEQSCYRQNYKYLSPSISTKSCRDYIGFTQNLGKKSMLGQKPIINSNVSSPNASQYSNNASKRQSLNKDSIQRSAKRDSLTKKSLLRQRSKFIQICYEDIILPLKHESVAKDNQEEEEDANVPEDVDDHVNSSQMERPKSQIRILNKSFSYNSMPEVQSPGKDKRGLAIRILNEVRNQRMKIVNEAMTSQVNPIIQHITLNTSQYYQQTTIPGEGFNDVNMGDISACQGIKDDSIGINQPRNDNFSPRFATCISKLSDLKNRLNEEMFEAQFHQSYQQIGQFFSELIQNRGKGEKRKTDFNSFQNYYKSDQLSLMFLIDKGYYFVHFQSREQIVKLINISMAIQMNPVKSFNKNIKKLYQYELINSLLQLILSKQLSHQSCSSPVILITESITEASPKKTNKHMKLHVAKSPSLCLLNQITTNSNNFKSTIHASQKSIKLDNNPDIQNTVVVQYKTQISQPIGQMKNKKCEAVKLNQKWPESSKQQVLGESASVQKDMTIDKSIEHQAIITINPQKNEVVVEEPVRKSELNDLRKKTRQSYLNINKETSGHKNKLGQKVNKQRVESIKHSKFSSIIVYDQQHIKCETPYGEKPIFEEMEQQEVKQQNYLSEIQDNRKLIESQLSELKRVSEILNQNTTDKKPRDGSKFFRESGNQRSTQNNYQRSSLTQGQQSRQSQFQKKKGENDSIETFHEIDGDITLKQQIMTSPTFVNGKREKKQHIQVENDHIKVLEDSLSRRKSDLRNKFNSHQKNDQQESQFSSGNNYFTINPNYQIAHTISNSNFNIQMVNLYIMPPGTTPNKQDDINKESYVSSNNNKTSQKSNNTTTKSTQSKKMFNTHQQAQQPSFEKKGPYQSTTYLANSTRKQSNATSSSDQPSEALLLMKGLSERKEVKSKMAESKISKSSKKEKAEKGEGAQKMYLTNNNLMKKKQIMSEGSKK